MAHSKKYLVSGGWEAVYLFYYNDINIELCFRDFPSLLDWRRQSIAPLTGSSATTRLWDVHMTVSTLRHSKSHGITICVRLHEIHFTFYYHCLSPSTRNLGKFDRPSRLGTSELPGYIEVATGILRTYFGGASTAPFGWLSVQCQRKDVSYV